MLDRHHSAGRAIADELAELAWRVRRLVPSHRDPEHYHVEKSEIEDRLRRLAKEVTA